jgi:hypothetical protein
MANLLFVIEPASLPGRTQGVTGMNMAVLVLPAGKTNHSKYRLALPEMLVMGVYLSVTVTLLGKSNHDQLL